MWNRIRLWLRSWLVVDEHRSWSFPYVPQITVNVGDDAERLTQAEKLLGDFHQAYRNCMTSMEFQKAFSSEFYAVGKETAKFLDIPLWRNITPPGGMSVSGGEPVSKLLTILDRTKQR